VIAVLAGRHAPAQRWREDAGWQTLMHVMRLQNLSAEESRAYLARRSIPESEHEAILSFTHGHPLALSLVAEVFAQRPNTRFQPQEVADVIQMLIERIAEQAPGPLFRAALEAPSLVRVPDDSILSALLDTPDVRELFAWLRDLSFMDAESRGLFPHDLAREALARDIRWRNPDRFAMLHSRARRYYMDHIKKGDSRTQREYLNEFIFLHRDNPMVRPFFEWRTGGQVFTDHAQEADQAQVLAIIAEHEGEQAAQHAAYWLLRQPENAFVFRTAGGDVQGLLLMVSMERLDLAGPEDSFAGQLRDPALARAVAVLAQRAPLRSGERATYFRFWMARDTYQAVSPVQSRIFLNIVQHYLTTPGLAFTFLPCADPEFWAPAFTYADLERIPEADFGEQIPGQEGRAYGVYGHDWRLRPPAAWLELLAEREMSLERVNPAPPPLAAQLLSREEFAAAVRDALRSYGDTLALQGNPLLKSRMVSGRLEDGGNDPAGKTPEVNSTYAQAAKTQALQGLLKEAADQLQLSLRNLKLYRAVYHTYLQPAPSQEAAAELLDVPYSTFRRHLAQGVNQMIAYLWQLEIA
jgi:hypothetical protein